MEINDDRAWNVKSTLANIYKSEILNLTKGIS